MYMYIYVSIYICMYIFVCVYIYIYIYIYIHTDFSVLSTDSFFYNINISLEKRRKLSGFIFLFYIKFINRQI